MDNQDYIRKAVELADGFRTDGSGFPRHETDEGEIWDHQIFCDALAAQLVRQVCATPKYDVILSKDGAEIFSGGHAKGIEYDIKTISMARSDDITMNAIKAIVDSGVLNGQ